jgi:MFS family permease
MPLQRRLVLNASCVAMLAVGENSTAIMAALPAISSSLGLDAATAEWAVNAYLVCAAVFIILGGEAADKYGSRRSSAAGIALFALASLVIALAQDGRVLVAARALQGLGAAFAVAGTLAAVTEAAPEAGRAGAISSWTGFLMLGFSLGSLIGGVVTHYAGWRLNFWLNVVIMFPAALGLGWRAQSAGREKSRVDWLGAILLAVSMVALIWGLRGLAAEGANVKGVILPFVFAGTSFVALFVVETRCSRPLLDFTFFAKHDFALASLLAFLLMFDIMTLLLYYNLFAQARNGFSMSAVAAGFSLFPLSVALFGLARAAPRISASVGIRTAMVSASLVLALGCAIVWASLAGPRLAILIVGLLAAGAGIALPYASVPRIGLSALPLTQAGKGSGVLNACSFLGGTIGVTCGGIVFGHAGFAGVLVLLAMTAFLSAAFISAAA